MMKFVVPEMEIMWFSTVDVLTTSETYYSSPIFEPECPAELPLM